MARALGARLGVVHRRQLAPIPFQVRRGFTGTLFVGTCADPELRALAETWMEEQLGPGRVRSVDVSAGPSHAWANLREVQLAEGGARPELLYTMWGLGALAQAQPGRPHPYVGLNLNRDAIGSSGTNLLVWLDNVGELARFVDLAPDFWSRRAHVAMLLSAADFEGGGKNTLALDDIEAELDRLKGRVREARGWREAQAALLIQQGRLYLEQNRPREALARVERAAGLLRDTVVGLPVREPLALGELRAYALLRLSRGAEATTVALHLLAQAPPAERSRAHAVLAVVLLRQGRIQDALASFQEADAAPPPGLTAPERAHIPYHRALAWGRLGKLRAAHTELDNAAERLGAGPDGPELARLTLAIRAVRGQLLLRSGEPLDGLPILHDALRTLRSAARHSQAATCAEVAVDSYVDLGLTAAALALLDELQQLSAPQGPRADAHTHGRRSATLWQRPSSAVLEARAEAEKAADIIKDALEREQERNERFWLLHDLARIRREHLAPTYDGDARAAELTRALQTLDEADAELVSAGLEELRPDLAWARARTQRAAHRHAEARLSFELAAGQYAAQGRPDPLAEVLAEAAENELDAGDPEAALRRVAEGVPTAQQEGSVYRQVELHRAARRAHARLGHPAEADAAFAAALGLLRAEGLLPDEIDLLLDRGEDPLVPAGTRRADAEAALDLAVRIGHVYRESRALLLLARLCRDDGETARALRLLDAARELAAELGPRDRLREIDALLAELRAGPAPPVGHPPAD